VVTYNTYGQGGTLGIISPFDFSTAPCSYHTSEQFSDPPRNVRRRESRGAQNNHTKTNDRPEMGNTTLNLVHDVLAQHDLISFRHRLTQQGGFRSAKQDLVSQAIVDSLYEIDQENLLVVLEARCPKAGNSISEQLQAARINH